MSISKNAKPITLSSLIHEDNPRSDATLHLDAMVASYELHGFQPGGAIMVEELSPDEYRVLRGNRRSLAALQMEKEKPEVFAKCFPNGTIPAFVCKGLSEEERILLRIDHSDAFDRVALDSLGMFNAISQLALTDLTQDGIADHLNLFLNKEGKKVPNRSLVQQRCNLAKLPKCVQDEFRILMVDGPKKTPVRWGMVNQLYKVYRKDYVNYPDGTMEFKELWEKNTTPAKPGKAGKTANSLSASKATDLSMNMQAPVAKAILLAATGQGKQSLADLDKLVLDGETAIATLAAIKANIGDDDYNGLVQASLELAQAREDVDPQTVDMEPETAQA